MNFKNEEEKILFSKTSGKVLTENYTSWYAENYETSEVVLANKGIRFVQNSYVTIHDSNCLLLGDVASLIKEITGVHVELSELEKYKNINH